MTGALIDSIVAEAMRKMLANEEEVAKAALEMGCGYAVIEEPLDTIGDFEQDSYKITITRHYLITGLIPKMNRFAFPSFDAFERWKERQ